MKKTFLSVAILVIAVLCMTSCSNKERCWKGEITIEYEHWDYDLFEDEEVSEKTKDKIKLYTWGTEEEVRAVIEELEEEYKDWEDEGDIEDLEFSYTIEKEKASESDCEDKRNFEDLDDINFDNF